MKIQLKEVFRQNRQSIQLASNESNGFRLFEAKIINWLRKKCPQFFLNEIFCRDAFPQLYVQQRQTNDGHSKLTTSHIIFFQMINENFTKCPG